MKSKQKLTFQTLDEIICARGDTLYGQRKTDQGWEPITWAQLRQSCLKTAVLLKRLHGGKRPIVGILASTRFEWNLCDFAVLALGGVVVGFYNNDRDEPGRSGTGCARHAPLNPFPMGAKLIDWLKHRPGG